MAHGCLVHPPHPRVSVPRPYGPHRFLYIRSIVQSRTSRRHIYL